MKYLLSFLLLVIGLHSISAQVYDTIPSITFENQDDIDSFSSQYPFENIIVDGDVRLRANTNYENTDSLYNIVEIRGDFFADAMGDFPGRLNGSISLPKLKYVNEFRPPSGTYSLNLPMLHTTNVIELGLRYWNPDLTYLPVTLTELNMPSLTTVESFICQRLTMSNDTLIIPTQLDSIGVLNLHETTLKALVMKDSLQFDVLRLRFNHDLATCNIPAFCMHASSVKPMFLSDNFPGCNSRSIIVELCDPTSDCPPDSTYTACKQQDVDQFILSYPDCDKLKSITLYDDCSWQGPPLSSGPISSLSGFSNIKEVTNDINIFNLQNNFIGLDSLKRIGGVFRVHGWGLTSAQGLEQLEYIKEFELHSVQDSNEFQLPSLRYCETINIGEIGRIVFSIPHLLEINKLSIIFLEDLILNDTLTIIEELRIVGTNISPCEYPAICNFLKRSSNYELDFNNENCSGSEDVIAICNASDFDSDGSTFDVDCDDLNPSSYPGAIEILDNDVDEDCDGFANTSIDEDMDGYDTSQDCDDLDPSVNPAAEEIINNEVDENCDGLIEIDMDQDGFLVEDDCNDLDPLVNPDMTEILNNGIDDDCNILTLDTLSMCVVGSISLNNQEELDDFKETYKYCNLTIEGDLESSFSQDSFNLEMVVSVNGSLNISNKEKVILPNMNYVENANLWNASLMNLNSLQESRFLEIRYTDLQTLELPELKAVGSLRLRDNNQLTELLLNDSLRIDEFLFISLNPNLSNCSILPICNYLQSGGNASIADNNQNCNSESEILADCITTTTDKLVNQIKIYPNPATNYFFIESEIEATVSLSNIYGSLSYTKEIGIGSHMIDVSSLAVGVYFLEVVKDGKTFINKIIVGK